MDSYFGDHLPRFDGNDLLLEPCSGTAASAAALAAELRHQAGWTRRGCCRDRCHSRLFFPPKAARRYTGQRPGLAKACSHGGGSHSIPRSAAAWPSAPSLPCRFP